MAGMDAMGNRVQRLVMLQTSLLKDIKHFCFTHAMKYKLLFL